ncbi:cytochrome P450 [Thamnidium elegans]|nr:cytochrome P450 [Thamnidium elegans]
MSLLENSFLKLPLQNAIQLYGDEVVPRLTKRNKVIAIGTAVALSIIYFLRDRVTKPPRKLRHIPYLSYFGVLKSMYYKESVRDRSARVHIPEINSENSNGLFLEVARNGWVLHVANPEDAKRVFLKLELFPKIDLSAERSGTLNSKFTIGPNLPMINGAHWKAQRKVANPAFRRSMPVKLFGQLTQEMFKSMENKGFDFKSIHNKDSEWVHRYARINEGLRDPIFFLFPYLDTNFRWLFPHRVETHKQTDIFLEMLDEVIKSKKLDLENGVKNNALEENERDLLSLMLESGEEGNGILSNKELKSNLCAFFLAGHDTTANALSYAIHYLAENQGIQEKARQEAISILGDEPCDILPTIEDTKKMTYINQIMKETLRINGPVARTLPRVVQEDIFLSGTFVPKGTLLVVNMFGIQHSNKIWSDPDVFNPDRFSENGEGIRETGEGMAWVPFGNGARQCIGMNFSLNEQRVLLSMLLRKYRWSTPKDSPHKNGIISAGLNVQGPVDLDIAFQKLY